MARRDLKAEIIAAAATDDAFRAELLRDPRAAISARFGVTLPSALRVDVVEDTADHVTMVLPLRREDLPDSVLDAAAGGTGCHIDNLVGFASGSPIS